MRKIIEILFKERRESKDHGTYFRTTALLDDGTEAVGYGEEFNSDDLVEVFFHHDVIKMRRKPAKG